MSGESLCFMTVLRPVINPRSPSLETSCAELLTHFNILPRNANECRSISQVIWPILELVQKEVFMKLFTSIAIGLLVLIALLHILRLVFGWEVIIHGVVMPMWASTLGVIIPGGLAFMVWRESRRGKL